ncbi:cysteine hydrolase [SAR202 cluster bacterium AC-647-N09_OGT_505m]|nr:cysteine hydrolase [SAR202 cluster bacterium AC-647-N09_OGT_505m]
MPEFKLDRNHTALLMADFHTEGMGQNPIVAVRHTFERASEVLEAARVAGVLVAYIVVNFRPGYPEISDFNKTFSARKASGQVPAMDPTTLIHPSVSPRQGEPIIVKHRVNAFFGTDLDMMLRAQGVDTLILMGHATSGVILSTVRYAADADYQLIVVEDGCADRDPEVHKLLMEKILSRQSAIASAEEVVAALGASSS